MPEPFNARLLDIYDRLFARMGPQYWWPGDGPFEVILGAILTQAAAWKGVERAMDNLRQAGVLSPEDLRRIPEAELAALLRPAVYFNAKARKVKAFVSYLGERYGDDIEAMTARDTHELRDELLAVHGIGEETADDILLYAIRKPVFVIDAYTKRVFQRLGIAPKGQTYRAWQAFFHHHLPRTPLSSTSITPSSTITPPPCAGPALSAGAAAYWTSARLDGRQRRGRCVSPRHCERLERAGWLGG